MQTIKIKRMHLRLLLDDRRFEDVVEAVESPRFAFDQIFRYWCRNCAIPYAYCECMSERGNEHTPFIIIED